MDAEELDKQFKAVEFDKSGNVIPPSSPPTAARKKRKTVADVDKRIDEITDLIDVEIHGWLDQLDTRVRHFENAEAEKPDSAVTNVTDRLHAIESVGLENLPSFISDCTERFEKLEKGIATLSDSFLLHPSEVPGEHPTPPQEIEFGKPPEPPAAVSTRAGDIEAVASVCVSMGDILMICRALRYAQDINVIDKNKILNTACRMVGVEVTHGLQIRAGIHDTR